MVKVFVFCWFQVLVRWTMPRLRYDQLMWFGWRFLLPVGIVNLVVTAAVFLLLQG
jgi:NADH-quinone oxidoreductase subunit H